MHGHGHWLKRAANLSIPIVNLSAGNVYWQFDIVVAKKTRHKCDTKMDLANVSVPVISEVWVGIGAWHCAHSTYGIRGVVAYNTEDTCQRRMLGGLGW